MALMSDVEVPINVLRAQIASAVDTIVQVARYQDGSRRVSHVAEILGYHQEHGYDMRLAFESPSLRANT
jgi:pilus assembly protein CpaF